MSERAKDEAVTRIADALQAGEWHEALELLNTVESERELSHSELEMLAQAAYGSGDLEASIEAWELLHTRCTAEGDLAGAANAATTIALYLMMDTGLMAPVRAWVTRAERLLDGREESETDAWLAVVRIYERFMCGDMESAGKWAQEAIEIGTRQRAPTPVAFGNLATARLAILDGEVDPGLKLLDQVAGEIMAGGIDPLPVGMIFCELICAMQGLAQYDRAEEWTDAMERWRQGTAFGGINGRCRVHRAEILRLRGSCQDAETEALHACEELRPWMRREYGWPLAELGTIRLRRGDLAGAEEAFRSAHQNGWDPQPGLALVRLAQGDAAAAAALIDHALNHPAKVPSKERPPYGGLVRAPLLDAKAEIALAAGDAAGARIAADELSELAATYRSRALSAGSALARARASLAAGEPIAAVDEAEASVAIWLDIGAPYEAAVARLVLADGHRALGASEQVLMELEAARLAFERIGAVGRAKEAALACEASGSGVSATPATIERPAPDVPADPHVFSLDGDTRTLEYGGRVVLLRDLKGMRYLAHLLAAPGREFHVLELVAAERGVPLVPGSTTEGLETQVADDAGPMLDSPAKEAYRRRLQEIEDDIEEATRTGDSERAALAEADRDYLVRELSRAFGLGGRERRAHATSERARTSVARAVRYTLDRIAEHHDALAEHLRQTIRTGTYCGYFPDPRIATTWRV